MGYSSTVRWCGNVVENGVFSSYSVGFISPLTFIAYILEDKIVGMQAALATSLLRLLAEGFTLL